jgi:hypothetical protein
MYGQFWISLIVGHDNNDIWLFGRNFSTSRLASEAGDETQEPVATS